MSSNQQQIDYTKYDFDTLLQQLNAAMAQTGSWDIFKSGTGQMLLELYAYVGAMMGYYAERRAQESYLLTAQLRSSLLNLAALVGYQPQLRTSAYTDSAASTVANVVLTVDTRTGHSIAVDRGTKLSTSDGVMFYVTESVSLESSVEVSVMQGTLVSKAGFSSGNQANFSITIAEANLEATPPRVTVGLVEWTWVKSFYGYSGTDKVYKTTIGSDDSVTVVFGDGVRGAIPSGDISLEYTISDGAAGNVTTPGAINTVVTPLYWDDEVAAVVSVTNNDSVLGGADIETNEQIRDAAPAVFATGDRAVTAADCRAIANQIAGVVDSVFWGEYDTTPTPPYDYTKMNTVYYALVTSGYIIPAPVSDYVDLVEASLRDKGMMTVLYSYEEAVVLNTIIRVGLGILPSVNLTNIRTKASAAIAEEFVLGDTAKLGVAKYRSVLEQSVQAIAGVKFVHLTMHVKDGPGDVWLNGTGNVWRIYTSVTPVLPGTVEVWYDGALVGTDNGDGGIVFTPTAFSAGSVDYASGLVSLTNAVFDDTKAYILYQQNYTDMPGDLIVGRSQIVKLDSVQFV